MKEFYALIYKGSVNFIVTSSKIDWLNQKIQEAYQSKNGIRPKGTDYSLEDFMENKEIIKVTFELV
jgi:hypothetical protein